MDGRRVLLGCVRLHVTLPVLLGLVLFDLIRFGFAIHDGAWLGVLSIPKEFVHVWILGNLGLNPNEPRVGSIRTEKFRMCTVFDHSTSIEDQDAIGIAQRR